MGSIADRKCTRFQSVKMTDWKLVHSVPWRPAKDWKERSLQTVNFSDWKHVRFHSMALFDDLLLQILPVREVDGLVARTYHSVSRYRRTVSTVTFSPRS